MNATQKELAIATIDVFFDSVQLVVSLARFTIALGTLTREAAQVSYEAGKATRKVVQPWIDWVAEEIKACQPQTAGLTIPGLADPWEGEVNVQSQSTANQVISFPRLAPVSIAGYLAPGLDVIEADVISTPSNPLDSYEGLGIRELRHLAKSKGITKYSRKDKATLLEELATI
ncbi:hypothetical protein [Synechococcus sp. PCC 6312]|uniref:hypothetical protein n=1 Tax=Synechococcus sp. (strain ATCC 27167 / PCC 6312) TaxID=195253 RepID=UPI00029F00C6|nr:hypothetical protein [Synechococcus sp. PCC 6312]AFY62793.1 hypothetical protein Syn6312_3783 [Synechococcus sp. PCC 6312]